MSQTPAILHSHAPGHRLPRASAIATILVTASAAAVISSLVTAEVLKRAPAAAEQRAAAIAPAAPVPVAVPLDTSVPDASAVFADKEFAAEEPAPTF